jgi:Na+/H+-dicarboxylate symporter
MALPLRILAGLLAGLVAGVLLAGRSEGLDMGAQAVGRLWLNALTMTVVPLVFALLVTGVAEAAASARGGRLAARAIGWFAGLLLAAALLCVPVTLLLLALLPPPEAAFALVAEGPASRMPGAAAGAHWADAVVAPNVVAAAAETAMVPLVLFALLFGLAASRLEAEPQRLLTGLFRAVAQAMLLIVHWVLWLAPLGIAALAFGVGARAGAGAAGALAHYMLVVIGACLAVLLLAVVAAVVIGRMRPLGFLRAALPAQAVAMSTQSSLASLPAMVSAAGPLGVGAAEAGVVLPLAVSLFRAASAGANVAVALYLAHIHGVEVGAAGLLAGAVTAAVVSVGAVGLPAQVSFFAVIAPICLAMGVPIGLLPLLLAVETVPDMFRTLGNVTADLAVTRLAGRGTEVGEPVRQMAE